MRIAPPTTRSVVQSAPNFVPAYARTVINSARLQVLLEIARLGTIAGASGELGLSPSAVSHQLAALERELGVSLVERGPRSLNLTDAGARLADYAQQITDLMSAAEDELSAHGHASLGVLRCGFFATSGTELLPRALAAFSSVRPGVEVDLVLGQPLELLPVLERRELDVAVVFEHPLAPMACSASCDLTLIMRDEQRVLLPKTHPLAGCRTLDLRSLARDPWITTRGTDSSTSVLERAATLSGFRPRVRCRSDHYEVTRALVRAGMGVALVPTLALRETDDLVARPVERSDLHREISVATRRNNPNPVVGAFIDCLHDAATELRPVLEQR